jgi:hypothetical protein
MAKPEEEEDGGFVNLVELGPDDVDFVSGKQKLEMPVCEAFMALEKAWGKKIVSFEFTMPRKVRLRDVAKALVKMADDPSDEYGYNEDRGMALYSLFTDHLPAWANLVVFQETRGFDVLIPLAKEAIELFYANALTQHNGDRKLAKDATNEWWKAEEEKYVINADNEDLEPRGSPVRIMQLVREGFLTLAHHRFDDEEFNERLETLFVDFLDWVTIDDVIANYNDHLDAPKQPDPEPGQAKENPEA